MDGNTKRSGKSSGKGRGPSRKNGSNKNGGAKSAPTKQARKAARARPLPAGNGQSRNAAAAYSKGSSSSEPRLTNYGRDGVRIQHRELIGSITGSVAFTVAQTVALNPGLAASFPWLATQAVGWEQYRFNRLRFCYYTRTGTSTPGSMMMVPDYDASDAAPGSEQIASAYRDVEEEAVWVEEFCCDLRAESMHPTGQRKFVRSAALPANQDIKLSDAGNMYLCTVDGTAVAWGKVWVEYDVSFFVPQLPPGGSAVVGTLVSGGGSLAAATPFGAAPTAASSFALNAAATNVVTFSGMVIGQVYSINWFLTGTVITVSSNGALVGGTSISNYSAFNAAATSCDCTQTFTATATSGSLTLTVTATTVTGGKLVMCSLPISL